MGVIGVDVNGAERRVGWPAALKAVLGPDLQVVSATVLRFDQGARVGRVRRACGCLGSGIGLA